MLISITDIIKKSWELYAKHWCELSVYMLFIFLPTFVMMLVGLLGIYLTMYLPSSLFVDDLITLIIFVIGLLFGLWSSLALTLAIKSLWKDSVSLPWKEAYQKTLPKIWPMIYTSALVSLVILGGSILLIIPGLIFTVWYSFSAQEILFDDQRGLGAMRASKQLVVGRWWSILVRLILPNFLFLICSLAVQQILTLPLVFIQSASSFNLIKNIISSLVNAAITPLTIATVIILYFSAKETPVVSTPPPTSPPASI